jgi:hypothetical protein
LLAREVLGARVDIEQVSVRTEFCQDGTASVITNGGRATPRGDHGGVHGAPVSQSTCASRTADAVTSMVPKQIGSWKRRGPIEPGLKTVSPGRGR